MTFLDYVGKRSRATVVSACLAFIALTGLADFLSGFEIFFSVFYLIPVAVGTWFIGRNFGLVLSVVSAAAWISGDFAAGAHFSSSFVPVWNSAILLGFYSIVVFLLDSLRALQAGLEERVLQRTSQLQKEMTERERLEKQILEVSEREQRRIGRDLHDSLCQHFTGTALACRVLEEKLSAHHVPEARDVTRILDLVEEGITMARALARGIAPVEMEAEGLVAAFQTLAANISKLSPVKCVFENDHPVLIRDAATATHLYRIAQEAVANAIRHGKAGRIDISLASWNNEIVLAIEDDGIGLPETWQTNSGLGTRIMAHRALMIAGKMTIEPNPTGGTVVTCSVPMTGNSVEEVERARL